MQNRESVYFSLFCFLNQWRTDPVHSNPISATWTNEKYKYGFIAWAAVAFIVLTSLPIVRRKLFNTFLYSHFAFIIFFIFSLKHSAEFKTYFVVSLVVYGLDKLIRVVSGMLPSSTIDIDVRHNGIVKLTFPKGVISQSLGTYKTGQYVSFVCVCVRL